jgi:hypothetical protein
LKISESPIITNQPAKTEEKVLKIAPKLLTTSPQQGHRQAARVLKIAYKISEPKKQPNTKW